MRYYNSKAYNFDELLFEINIKQYSNEVISTGKIFMEFPQIMHKYDIRDEYELHNLLRRFCVTETYPTMVFKRMPNIMFG